MPIIKDGHISLAEITPTSQLHACANCGTRVILLLPMPVREYARHLRAFERAHKRCEPMTAPPAEEA